VVLLVAAPSAYALRVGWNVDIHQGKFGSPQDPDYANDFHIWGILESGSPPNWLPAPAFVSQVNFLTSGPPNWIPGTNPAFETFSQQISKNPVNPRPLPPMAPPIGGPFYYFDANWSTAGQIPFCQWVHFGLEFDEECHNVGYWLQGVWTKDGVDPPGSPIYGFRVEDLAVEQYIRIQNASGHETTVKQMDLMVLNPTEAQSFRLEDLNTDFFNQNPQWDARWIEVPQNLLPTSPLPGDGDVDSFFDVYFEGPRGVPGMRRLEGGEMLLARQLSEGSDEWWQYEMHGTHTYIPIIPEPATVAIWGLLGLCWAVLRVRQQRRKAALLDPAAAGPPVRRSWPEHNRIAIREMLERHLVK